VKDKYYIWNTASLITLLGVLPGIFLQNAMIVGAAVLFSYFLYWQSVKVARLRGRTTLSKILDSVTGNLIEFGGISAAFFFTEPWSVIFALALIGFQEATINQLKKSLGKLTSEILGRTERILVLSASFIAFQVNEYFLLYGVILVGLLALIEICQQLFVLLKQ
jgi:hypothetical protein